MEHFLGFALPGIPYGCTYAIVAVSLVLTYQATGVFNFAFGAQAFAAAFVFTVLTENHHMAGWLAFVISVVVMSPLIGLAFDRFIFRHVPNSNTTAKLICSISLLVGIVRVLCTHSFFSRRIDPWPSPVATKGREMWLVDESLAGRKT